MVIVNGQRYNDGEIPDFGTVKIVGVFHAYKDNHYLFKDADRDKLDLLIMAGDGSLAYCTDKKYFLIKHDSEWVEA